MKQQTFLIFLVGLHTPETSPFFLFLLRHTLPLLLRLFPPPQSPFLLCAYEGTKQGRGRGASVSEGRKGSQRGSSQPALPLPCSRGKKQSAPSSPSSSDQPTNGPANRGTERGGGRGGRPSIRGTNKISGQEHFKRFMGEGEGRGTLPPAREKREEGAARAARKYIFCCLFPPFFAPPPPTIFFPPLVQYIHMPNDQRRRGKKRR